MEAKLLVPTETNLKVKFAKMKFLRRVKANSILDKVENEYINKY